MKTIGKLFKGALIGIGMVVVIIVVITMAAMSGSGGPTSGTAGETTTTHSEKPKTDADKSDEQLHKEAGEPDEKVSKEFASAVGSAQSYSDMMSMSKDAIKTQLTDFDKFPEDAAEFAVNHIEVDWNKNAAQSAESYQESMNMSSEAIRDQLVNFDKFTQEEADYGVSQLDK